MCTASTVIGPLGEHAFLPTHFRLLLMYSTHFSHAANMDQVEEQLIEVRKYAHLYDSLTLHYCQMAVNSWREPAEIIGVDVRRGNCRAMRICRRTSINAFNGVGHVCTLWRRATHAADAEA